MTVLVVYDSHPHQIPYKYLTNSRKFFLSSDLSISSLLSIRALRVAGLITDTRCVTAFYGFRLINSRLRFLCNES
jgi:hypothetical protein